MGRTLNLLAAFLVAAVFMAATLSELTGRRSPALWLFSLASLAGWVTWLVVRARRLYRPMRRRWNLQCPVCGYSLRGNTSGVCPECGTPT